MLQEAIRLNLTRMPRTACGLSLIHQGDENTGPVHQQQLGWHLERCSVLEASRLKSPDDLELQLSRARGNAHVVGRHACCCDGSSLQLCQLCLQLGHILPDALQTIHCMSTRAGQRLPFLLSGSIQLTGSRSIWSTTHEAAFSAPPC